MKLLIAISLAEHRESIQEIYSKNQVSFYNEIDMKGVKKLSGQHRLGNWFGSSGMHLDNIAFISFMDDDQAEGLFNQLMQFKDGESNSLVNAYLIDIAKSA